MSAKILTYPTFRAAGEAAVAAIRRRTVDLDTRHILIVPDKYTLYYEKRLFAGGGAFDVEVLTLNRLFQRVTAGDAYLSRQGAIMLLRGIVAENADKLVCFKRSAKFKGFAEKLYNVFSQLVSSGADIASLTADGALGLKLQDIRLLYELYVQKTAGVYTDASGRLELLRRHADCEYVRRSVLYVTGHYGVTKQMRAVFDALGRAAQDMTVFECEPVSGTVDGATVYASPDDVTAIKAVARRINNLAYSGATYGDMCVVTADGDAEIKRIFTEHGVPFFADSTTKLIAHPLARFVLTAVDCAERGYRRRDIVKLAKNPCSGIDRRDADALENYCNRCLIDYLGFFRPFDEDAPERARRKLAALLTDFSAALKTAAGPELFARAVTDLLAKAVCEDEQARDKTAGLLAQLSALLPERCPLSLVTDCFTEGLNAATMGALPKYTDTVTVGPPEVFRGQAFGHVFIVGFNDGVLPAYVSDAGLLSDTECEALGGVEPTVAQINARAAEELKQLACGAADLFVTYTDAGNARPSGVLTALLGKNCTFLSAADETDGLKHETGDTLRALAADLCADRAAVLEWMIVGARTGLPIASSLAAVIEDAGRYLDPPAADADTVDARGLYFPGGKAGVTELGCYFTCPRMHFYRYGLRLTPRETGEMSGLDVGNFLHATAERFASLPADEQTEDAVRAIVRDVMRTQSKYALERNAPLAARLADEAVTLCALIKRQLSAGTYENIARETGFGPGQPFAGIPLGGEPPVILSGKIDRVDVSGDFVRVIDYKTGSTGFSYPDVYYGRQLQLPVYMRAVRGDRRPGGMFYFPFRTAWREDAEYRLDGPFDSAPESLLAHERAYDSESKYKGTVIRCTTTFKEGLLKPYASSVAVDGKTLDALSDYAVRAAAQAVDEIRDGYARPAPLHESRRSPCAYCEFAAVCADTHPRHAGKPAPDDFLGDRHEQ